MVFLLFWVVVQGNSCPDVDGLVIDVMLVAESFFWCLILFFPPFLVQHIIDSPCL